MVPGVADSASPMVASAFEVALCSAVKTPVFPAEGIAVNLLAVPIGETPVEVSYSAAYCFQVL